MAAKTTPGLDFNAFDDPERIQEALDASKGKLTNCGWVPPEDRTTEQKTFNTTALKAMPRFTIRGRQFADQRRYPLWNASKLKTGKFLRYVWQQTGSCVGASGDNANKTGATVEIYLKNEPEEYKECWWLYTYGLSRQIGGLHGQGEGSFGTAYAEAITKYGTIDAEHAKLPKFTVQNNWLVIPAKTELVWSDGSRIGEDYRTLGKEHRWKTASQMRSADDCFEAVSNGYPLTLASMFGLRNMVPPVKGTKFPVRVGVWDGEWAHQMFCDEVWDHPELDTILFRIGNNWGPDAHGKPTGEEPPGGFYIAAKTMDQVCKAGEVFALSGYDGFPARQVELDFAAFN